jgi:hypothetical protein
MMNDIIEIVKRFLLDTLGGSKEVSGDIRVIGIDHANGIWTAEAEVLERNLALPKYRLFEKKRYIVKLTNDLEVSSYKQVKEDKDRHED